MSESQELQPWPEEWIALATGHVRDVVDQAIEFDRTHRALVVWDGESELSVGLAAAYRRALPEAEFLAFDRVPPEAILAAFAQLGAGDLVVLLQSTRFQLTAFRIRLELFQRSVRVIEHPHLARMTGREARVYVDALAYDPAYYRGVGRALKARLDAAQEGVVQSGGERLVFPAGFEDAKLNVGDYTGMANVGGQYPIGEVFTESRALEAVHGRVCIDLFGDMQFTVHRPERPITLVVEQGRVVQALDSTPIFDEVLTSIRADEGQVWLRELGLGMNRAFSPERTVRDVGSFERMCGVHLSLGGKHVVYSKPEIHKKHVRQHVDVFVATEDVLIDGQSIFRAGAWTIPPVGWASS